MAQEVLCRSRSYPEQSPKKKMETIERAKKRELSLLLDMRSEETTSIYGEILKEHSDVYIRYMCCKTWCIIK